VVVVTSCICQNRSLDDIDAWSDVVDWDAGPSRFALAAG
jgi:hypothetical protein